MLALPFSLRFSLAFDGKLPGQLLKKTFEEIIPSSKFPEAILQTLGAFFRTHQDP